ncbi:hypothetical protein [Sphingopyxis sp. H050]|uniref:hypothetical protein n=1 Tax=Sphingopyxis sp. H050 TaxID=1759072 RepID=UPI000AD0FAFC|nr:hypothetical protein [Sphingopyxis sp. H050]
MVKTAGCKRWSPAYRRRVAQRVDRFLIEEPGRIRLPKALVPPINAGGDDQHWWQLTDLVTTSDQIEAKYKLNGLNHPKLRIDRTTGEIVIKGFGQDFHGRCDPVDPGQRRF